MNKEKFKSFVEDCLTRAEKALLLIKELSEFDWTYENAKTYCVERNILINEQQYFYDNTQSYIKNINCSFCNELITNLENFIEREKELLSSLNEWDKYNISYQNYREAIIKQFNFQINNFFQIVPNCNFSNYIMNTYNNLKSINENVILNYDKLFEHFKYGNKNYVIFGKNGAGKTTLLKKISEGYLKDNSFVIPANRSLKIKKEGDIRYFYSKTFNEMLKDDESIMYLTNEIQESSLIDLQNGIPLKNTVLERVKYIFNNLGLERYIIIEKNFLFLQIPNKDERYSIFYGSDGEKAIIYLIMSILLLPQNAFVFIDEPERHLNGALMQKLFNILENERRDVKFIYVTHIINFVESRKNVELIYLEKTDKVNDWDFKNIDDFDSTDVNMILGIEGTQDDIIFCEGDNQNSIDRRILESVYDDCFVKPVSSCESVINNTRLLQTTGKYHYLKRNAYGIIDNDFRNNEEIIKLQENSIKVLNYNEWENLLLCEDIITFVNNNTIQSDINDIKEKIIKLIEKGKNSTFKDFLNKKIAKSFKFGGLNYNDNVEKEIDELNKENKEIVLIALKEYEDLINKFIEEKNYEELIKVVPAKRIFKESTTYLGFKDSDNYISRIMVLIKDYPDFKNLMKEKIGLQK